MISGRAFCFYDQDLAAVVVSFISRRIKFALKTAIQKTARLDISVLPTSESISTASLFFDLFE